MAVTITLTTNVPTVGADADTWGTENNANWTAARVDLVALAAALNPILTALLTTGGTMTGDLLLADVGPTGAASAGYRGLPLVTIDADRTFALTDAGKMIRLTGTTARTWTIPPSGSVAFPVGTVIVLRNAGTAAITLARGAGVALRLAGSATDANRSIAPAGQASIVQEAANVWTVSGVGVS